MPRASRAARFFSSAKLQNTMTSSRAVFTIRESSGRRRRESRITRNSLRLRASPVRSVSRGSSAIIVPTPTRIASYAGRNSCACSRARSLVIQPEPAAPEPKAETISDSPGGGAILPSRVMPAFSVTSGRRCRIYLAKASFSRCASRSSVPT